MFRGVPNDPWEGGPNGFRGTTINPGFRVLGPTVSLCLKHPNLNFFFQVSEEEQDAF